jgi:LCP family protein required for cell wall assembly
VLLIAWVTFLIVVPYRALGKASSVEAFPSKGRPENQEGTNYLLVGSDSREGLTEAERKELGTGSVGGQRTDTIMILHVGAGPDLLMSIPRDSLVEVPGQGRTKINAAFAVGGPKLLVQTIEDATGIYLDHYVEIGFGGFVGMVDAVDGIRICPTDDMKDPQANLDIEKGCQQADGVTALGYARSRKTSSLGDIDRAKHQREVVAAVGKKVVSWQSIVNPFRYYAINQAGARSVRLSEDTGVWAMGQFARAMTSVRGSDGRTCSVPLANLSVEWDDERAKEFFSYLVDDTVEEMPQGLCTPDGFPKEG